MKLSSNMSEEKSGIIKINTWHSDAVTSTKLDLPSKQRMAYDGLPVQLHPVASTFQRAELEKSDWASKLSSKKAVKQVSKQGTNPSESADNKIEVATNWTGL